MTPAARKVMLDLTKELKLEDVYPIDQKGYPLIPFEHTSAEKAHKAVAKMMIEQTTKKVAMGKPNISNTTHENYHVDPNEMFPDNYA